MGQKETGRCGSSAYRGSLLPILLLQSAVPTLLTPLMVSFPLAPYSVLNAVLVCLVGGLWQVLHVLDSPPSEQQGWSGTLVLPGRAGQR